MHAVAAIAAALQISHRPHLLRRFHDIYCRAELLANAVQLASQVCAAVRLRFNDAEKVQRVSRLISVAV